MDPAASPQHFDGAAVFCIEGGLLVLLLIAFVSGFCISAIRWRNNNQNYWMTLDALICLPIGGIVIWLFIPRVGLAGDKILAGYAGGDPGELLTFLLAVAVMMIVGMSCPFITSKMEAALVSFGSQLLVRIQGALRALLQGDGATPAAAEKQQRGTSTTKGTETRQPDLGIGSE